MNALPASVNLRGTRYRVQVSEGLIVFSEHGGAWGCRDRFSFQRKCGCWCVSIEGTHDDVMVSTILRAYEIVCEVYGGNFEGRNGEHNP